MPVLSTRKWLQRLAARAGFAGAMLVSADLNPGRERQLEAASPDVMVAAATSSVSSRSQPIIRTVRVRAGRWVTLERFWNAQATIWITGPAGADVKIRHGVGRLGWNRQRQRLDGYNQKTLSVSQGSSRFGARVQIRVPADTDVTYSVQVTGPGPEPRRPRPVPISMP